MIYNYQISNTSNIMKKILWYLLSALALVAAVSSCKDKDEKEPDEPSNVVATVKASDLIDAAAVAYASWEETTAIPTSLTVGGTTLTQPQYQYALCVLLTNLAAGNSSDIKVLGYKAAEHPDRDSYDKSEIAMTGGPSISEGTEDLVNIAKRMVEAMADKLTVPNQTLVTRSGASALAFSTNRATVTLLRALAAYKSSGSLPKNVSTEYLSASASLKGFAQQFVTYLDVWDKTVGTVSADGSHCSDNGSAWENVHFIPIPYSGGAYADGKDQYAEQYKPYHTITVDGVTYDAAQCFIVAAKGFIDLVTTQGSALKQTERNTVVHTLGNGAKLTEAIPSVPSWATWGSYPWYEKSDDPCAINFSSSAPCTIEFMVRNVNWFLTRAEALDHIGNFITFGDDAVTMDPYLGNISPMRTLLILARFYKHLLDNNITENVYDSVKDLNLDYDLYGVTMPDIELRDTELEFTGEAGTKEAQFNAKESWTATPSDSWITVEPSSGAAGTVVLKVTVAENPDADREGTVSLTGGNVTEGVVITVKQAKMVAVAGTLKEFAKEFVKGLDIWNATVGTVESEGKHLIEKGTAWENVHFIPVGKTGGPYDSHEGNQHDDKYTPWTLNVNGATLTSSQAWEIAIRGLMNLVTTEGEAFLDDMTDRNKAYTLGNGASLSTAPIPNASAANKWGNYPWYESDDNYPDGLTYNGAAIETVDVNFLIKVGSWHVVRSFIKVGSNTPLNAIGNFQQFGTSSSTLNLDGYEGLIAPMRELLIAARIYKYLLDNDIDSNVYDAIKDVKFDFDLYNQGAAPAKVTIKDFAQEYVKILDVWQSTTGSVTMYKDSEVDYTVEDAHYIPSTTTITVGDKTYTTADMWETALRSYLLIRGYDGLDVTNYGAGKISALDGGAVSMSSTEVPETHSYQWGSWPYNETEGNGGHLVLGTKDDGEHCKVKVDILDNWAMRSLNFQKGQPITNMCGYAGGQLAGYYGTFCSQRALITYAFFFKHMLDNNLDKGTEVSADTIIRTELFGDE